MLRLHALVLAALGAAVSVPAQTSWVQNPTNGHWYRLTAAQSWQQAEAEAVTEGGHLATLRTRDEHRWAIRQFGGRQMWIGLNDAAIEGTFVWSSGEPVSYTNFCPNEPNGLPGEDYVHIAWWCLGEAGGWNDQQGADLYPGLVEVQSAPNGWYQSPVNSHWYRTTDPRTWANARAEARADGGDLATIRDAAEMNWIVQQFGSRELWIGLNDAATEGTFEWSSGEPVGFTNWCSGAPLGTNPGDDYAHLSATCGTPGGWLDADGAVMHGGLIERTTPPGSGFVSVGQGCAGRVGAPILSARFGAVLRVDGRMDLLVDNLWQSPLVIVAGLVGFDDQAWGPVPLPFDLTAIGMTGCTLYNDIGYTQPLFRNGAQAEWSVTVPNDPRLLGLSAFFQAFVIEPGANPFGGIVSNGGRATVGF